MTQTGTVCARGRRARQELGRLDAHAAAHQSPAPLHDLTSQICHELRTPLNTVIGFSEMMRHELLGPVGNARYREYVDHINDSAQRMLLAAEETLAFATLLSTPSGPPQEQHVILSEAIADAVQLAGNRRGARSSAASVFVDNPISTEVWADRNSLPYALAHLICASHQISGSDQVRLSCKETANAVTVRVEPMPLAEEIETGNQSAAPDHSEADLMVMLASALLQSQDLPFNIAQPDGGRSWRAEIRLESSTQHQLMF